LEDNSPQRYNKHNSSLMFLLVSSLLCILLTSFFKMNEVNRIKAAQTKSVASVNPSSAQARDSNKVQPFPEAAALPYDDTAKVYLPVVIDLKYIDAADEKAVEKDSIYETLLLRLSEADNQSTQVVSVYEETNSNYQFWERSKFFGAAFCLYVEDIDYEDTLIEFNEKGEWQEYTPGARLRFRLDEAAYLKFRFTASSGEQFSFFLTNEKL